MPRAEVLPQPQMKPCPRHSLMFLLMLTNFIKISWKPPTHNGGSQITGYDVERRDILGGRWKKVTDKPVRDTKVEEGHQYEYKVRAYNAAGAGPHSDPSLSITARPMKCAPRLNLDVLNQRIRVI